MEFILIVLLAIALVGILWKVTSGVLRACIQPQDMV
jgi:hypothetical protein